MAETLPNGSTDVEMKEEEEAPPLESLQDVTAASSINSTAAQPDPTDPNPTPQATASSVPEHLSVIQPAAASTLPAASSAAARPSSMPPQPSARPEKPVAHGGPTRQFLNSHITPHLLEGMKHLAVYEPEKPLLWLSDFLRDKSKEVEG